MRYYLGMRGPALGDALGGVGVQPTTAEVLVGLCHAERPERAKALAGELGRLSAALDARGLFR